MLKFFRKSPKAAPEPWHATVAIPGESALVAQACQRIKRATWASLRQVLRDQNLSASEFVQQASQHELDASVTHTFAHQLGRWPLLRYQELLMENLDPHRNRGEAKLRVTSAFIRIETSAFSISYASDPQGRVSCSFGGSWIPQFYGDVHKDTNDYITATRPLPWGQVMPTEVFDGPAVRNTRGRPGPTDRALVFNGTARAGTGAAMHHSAPPRPETGRQRRAQLVLRISPG